MNLEYTEILKDESRAVERWRVMEEGREVSHATLETHPSRYCDAMMNTLTVGGVGTPPEHRRSGYVRTMFERMFEIAPERGWDVALLHPFSFAYYRKFGFEKISEHQILEFSLRTLDFVPRCSDLVPVEDSSRAADLVSVYERFAAGKNVMFPRTDGRLFPAPGDARTAYLWYDAAGIPQGYVILSLEEHLEINKMVPDWLHVYEMAYTCPAALTALLGFLRMFDGQMDMVRIHDRSAMPELDPVLRNYHHTVYRSVPDLAARILNTESFLKANRYPMEAGHFTLTVEDAQPLVGGCFAVEFGGGEVSVKKLAEGAHADVVLPAPALAVLLYGAQHLSAEIAAYLPGVRVNRPETDLFRAFPQRINALFEHF